MIELQEIIDMNQADILGLLKVEETSIEIYCPKSTQQFHSTNLDIADDYATLAYVGQKLKEVSIKFNYYVVSPVNHESVLFEIETNDLNKLAETIMELSHNFGNESEESDLFDFQEEVAQFIDDIENQKIEPACPEFIDFYEEFIELVNDKDIIDEE